MPTPRKIRRDQEAEFAAAYRDITVTVEEIARRYNTTDDTVYATARRLGLGYRMPVLERLNLPPFGKRQKEAA